MPGKSKHGKRKHSTLNKGRRDRQRSLAITSRQAVMTPVSTPVSLASVVDSKISVPAPSTTPGTDAHRYAKVELLRIGILTGIMLVILIVLALL